MEEKIENNSDTKNENNFILLFQKLFQNIKPELEALENYYGFNKHYSSDEESLEEESSEEEECEDEESSEEEECEDEGLEEDCEEDNKNLEYEEDFEVDEEDLEVNEEDLEVDEEDLEVHEEDFEVVNEEDLDKENVKVNNNIKNRRKKIFNRKVLDNLLEEISKDFFDN